MRLSFPDQASSHDGPLPEFASPPVFETSVGIQFEGLDGYTSLSAASFWDRIRSGYPKLEEHPPLDPQFETFGPASNTLAQPTFQFIQGAIQPRYFFVNEADDQLVQLQGDRLFFNWRKRPSREDYPRYTHVRQRLEDHLKQLGQWAADEKIGEILPTQCEAMYVNRVPLIDRAGRGCGLSFIFPWLSGLMGTTEQGVFRFSRKLSSEAGDPIARLHVTLRHGTDGEGMREAQLMLHVRGRPLDASIGGCLDMIDAEREVIVQTFADITSVEAHEMWGRKQ